MAAVNVQNRVSMAQGLLPAEVTQVGVTTQKRQTSMLMVFSIYDEKDQYDIEFLENYANINLISGNQTCERSWVTPPSSVRITPCASG